jgi:hypothetical protein
MPGGAGMTLMWVRNWPSPIKFGFSDGCIHATRGELLIEATIANPQMDGIAARQSRWESRDNQDENAPLPW